MPGFTTPDPLAEKHYSESPYSYCGGDPVNRMDPSGLDWFVSGSGDDQHFACLTNLSGIELIDNCFYNKWDSRSYCRTTITSFTNKNGTYILGSDCGVYRMNDVDQNTLLTPAGPSRGVVMNDAGLKLGIIANSSLLSQYTYLGNADGMTFQFAARALILAELSAPPLEDLAFPEITITPLPGIEMEVDEIASDATSIATSSMASNIFANLYYTGPGQSPGTVEGISSEGGQNGTGSSQGGGKYGKIIGYVSISASGAFGGGLAGEVGYVYTNKNYMQYYMSGGTTLGFGGNATLNIGKITALPGKNPFFGDFEGSSVNGGYSFTSAIGGQVSASQTYIGTGLTIGLGAKWNMRIGGGQENTILLGSPTYIGSPSNISSNNCFGGYYPY